MKFKPIDVTVTVTDNDDIATQGAITCSSSDEAAGTCTQCRQTSLFSSTGKTEWLVDHNCEGGDAGGLPGYPVSKSGSQIVTNPLVLNRFIRIRVFEFVFAFVFVAG